MDISVEESCLDSDNGSILLSNVSNNAVLSYNGQVKDPTLGLKNMPAGTYILELEDSNGCKTTEEVIITSRPALIVSVPIDSSDCFPEGSVITPDITSAAGIVDYLWSNGSTASTIYIKESDNYVVTISDDCDEKIFDFDIEIDNFDDNQLIYIPNIFSPNDDQVNDCFLINPNPTIDIIEYKLQIYDRWGELMYTTQNMEDCWTGYFKGRHVVPGVYVYVIDMIVLRCNIPTVIKKVGDVTVAM